MRRISSLVPLWLLVLVSLAMAMTDFIDLPQISQAVCYDADGSSIACADPGQDGDIRADVEW